MAMNKKSLLRSVSGLPTAQSHITGTLYRGGMTLELQRKCNEKANRIFNGTWK
jgi:hypothetical protein